MKGSSRNRPCATCGKKLKFCLCGEQARRKWRRIALSALALLIPLLIALYILTSGSTAASGAGSPTSTEERARETFLELVRTHPSQAVRDILSMLEQGTVRFSTSYPYPERPFASRTLEYVWGHHLIVANPDFLRNPQTPPCVLRNAIRHEVQHLEDDLAGMHAPPLTVAFEAGEDEWRRAIERMLHAEWRANRAADDDLRRIEDCPYLDDWYADEHTSCTLFKHEMVTNNFHIPTEALRRYPALRQWILGIDCDTLTGPF